MPWSSRARRSPTCSGSRHDAPQVYARKALGRRSRGDSHREAEVLVAKIVPDGTQAAGALRRLLNLKDEAHHGFFGVGGAHLRAALRQAQALVTFADAVLRR